MINGVIISIKMADLELPRICRGALGVVQGGVQGTGGMGKTRGEGREATGRET